MPAGLPKSFIRADFSLQTGWTEKSAFFVNRSFAMRKRISLKTFYLFFVVFVAWNPIHGKELIIQPAGPEGKDAYISCKYPGQNFGNASWLYIGEYDRYRALIQFDLSRLPPGVNISSATLCLHLDLKESSCWGGYEPGNFYVHRVSGFWKESEVTWNYRYNGVKWVSSGGDFLSSPESWVPISGNSQGWILWDVTAMVKSWYKGDYDNFGLILKGEQENKMLAAFVSSDSPEGPSSPKLVITYEEGELPPEYPSPKPTHLPIQVYPNPFKPSLGHDEVKFINLPRNASVKIFHNDGRLARKLSESNGVAKWDGKDDGGNRVASGIYIYLVESGETRLRGKIVVIR